jgi:hypothetical protein
MKHRTFIRTIGVALGVLALACTPEARRATEAVTPSAAQAFEYAGPAGTSHVFQQRSNDGLESLQGSTDVTSGPRLAHIVLEEAATLERNGQLRSADIVLHAAGATVRYRLEPSRATVHIERAGREAIEWRVPSDAPWLYGPTLGESGELVVTPVSAWIALRATQAGGVVRVLEPERRESHLVMIDQLAVATERGKTIALGYGADADERFITELRLLEDTPGLERRVGSDLGA